MLKDIQVLIVEDSPTQALELKELLQKNHMNVTVAIDGIDALNALSNQTPNLIISDIEMPKMNGYELCKAIKAHDEWKKIPVILLTILDDPLDAIKGVQSGADSFMTKPYDESALLATIENVLDNKNLESAEKSILNIEFFFNGNKHRLNVDLFQMTQILLSTFTVAIQKNKELQLAYMRLNKFFEEVKQKNKKLRELNDEKNKFLGMAAHDLRNPLGAIETYCGMLLADPENKFTDKAKKVIENIQNSSAYMLHIINDLLDVSAIESGQFRLHMVQANVVILISETLEYLAPIAERKNVKITLTNYNQQPMIYCDPNKIIQVITNLLSNAIKFSKAGNEVEIIVQSSETEVTIIVKDHGTGISPDISGTLFQPFLKGKKHGTEGEVGAGLGLAIVYKIVSEHGGKIWFESELGKGTTFYVTLPVKGKFL